MDKTFVIVVCAIAIIGFSASAYIFGQTDIISELVVLLITLLLKKLKLLMK